MGDEVVRSIFQRPDDPVDSFIVPLMILTVDASQPDPQIDAKSVEGTGFLVAGGRGLGITAGHVAKALRKSASVPNGTLPVAAFVDVDGNFRSSPVGRFEMHPTEDVALFRLADDNFLSPYAVSADPHYGGVDYCLWGYPDDVRHDHFTEQSQALHVPLVFSAGHIRRRLSAEIHIDDVPGRCFYELSAPAGGCCSGAPVSLRGDPFRVVGVYVGERRNFENTFAVGFATRSEVLAQQWPQLVDGTADLSSLCPFESITSDWTGP
jgi:hypothetical protein